MQAALWNAEAPEGVGVTGEGSAFVGGEVYGGGTQMSGRSGPSMQLDGELVVLSVAWQREKRAAVSLFRREEAKAMAPLPLIANH
jgi:hypothetical protein